VSDFAHNLARRGAGLLPIVAVQPPFVPDFAPSPPTRLRRPALRFAGGIGNAVESPHPIANSSEAVTTSVPDTEREGPSEAAASEQTPSPVGPASPSHPPVSYGGPPGLPARTPDHGTDAQRSTDAQLFAPYSPERAGPSIVDESRRREIGSPDDQPLSGWGHPMRADAARVSQGTSTPFPSLEGHTVPISEPTPVKQDSSADPADSSRAPSPSQEAERRHGPPEQVGGPQRAESGSTLETTDYSSAGFSEASKPESRGMPDPEFAPVRQDSFSGAHSSSRASSPLEGAREHSAPFARTGAPRPTTKSPNPEAPETIQKRPDREVAETVKPSGSTQPGGGEVKQVGSRRALLWTEEPLSGEPATSAEPASPTLVRPTPASVASPEAVRPTPVIVPELAQAKALPPLRRPAAAEPESVQVRIGSVEVRAATPPAPPSAPAPQGFDDYAAVRSYTGWERA
jgi:hypothetical protein